MSENTINISHEAAISAVADLQKNSSVELLFGESAAMINALTECIQKQLWKTKWWKQQCNKSP